MDKFLEKLVCNLGFHNWSDWELRQGESSFWGKTSEVTFQIRKCLNCKKTEANNL